MSQHTVAEAKNKLPELIKRAEKGEDVVITRHGTPVAKISAVVSAPVPKRITKEAVEWLDKHRVKGKIPKEDAGIFVSRMRDEEWPR
ncbi:MAG TPA: type II toxin-antitoxin system prevent-host-death family antitoxin [Rhizomicrobium sp.]|jgi:prevent-host-death family protein|nr:type II toxin-antitoxin system prevent-host-death family antitoxin [Rhizomicrobium sp.]